MNSEPIIKQDTLVCYPEEYSAIRSHHARVKDQLFLDAHIYTGMRGVELARFLANPRRVSRVAGNRLTYGKYPQEEGATSCVAPFS
jgi:hypothetical protein